jgi:hypothetical protein
MDDADEPQLARRLNKVFLHGIRLCTRATAVLLHLGLHIRLLSLEFGCCARLDLPWSVASASCPD